KAGTMHSTNRAFERYFQKQAGAARGVYQAVADLQQNYNLKGKSKNDNVLKINAKIGGGGGS
ncbi:MAG: hypothetical protein KFF50_00005, partial [Desulfatitalea sp.]|nr:hypothetical protein [Desulfatitalea sp.]